MFHGSSNLSHIHHYKPIKIKLLLQQLLLIQQILCFIFVLNNNQIQSPIHNQTTKHHKIPKKGNQMLKATTLKLETLCLNVDKTIKKFCKLEKQTNNYFTLIRKVLSLLHGVMLASPYAYL